MFATLLGVFRRQIKDWWQGRMLARQSGEPWAFEQVIRTCNAGSASEAYEAISLWLTRLAPPLAAATLTRLAEKLQAPVFMTPNGRGAIPEDHPLAIGNLYQSRKLHADMMDADLTIAIGTRFQVGVGGAGAALKPPGKLLHIDIDASIIDRVHKSDASLTGNAAEILPAIEAAMIAGLFRSPPTMVSCVTRSGSGASWFPSTTAPPISRASFCSQSRKALAMAAREARRMLMSSI